MEEDKILKILKKTPIGTKLYSSAFGKTKFNGVYHFFEEEKIKLLTKEGVILYLPSGKYKEDGEVTLYPSKFMRNWDKFAWKTGDVLRDNSDKIMVLFEKFTDDTYTEFIGKYFCKKAIIASDERKILKTKDYLISTEFIKEYIYLIEKVFGGKLDRRTLTISNSD